jgi:hypothetical protein
MTTQAEAASGPATGDAPGDPPNDKRDLWICWWIVPVFYLLFAVIFVPLTRVMPPPRPGLTTVQIVHFFHAHATTIKIGFALLMVVIGFGSFTNGLVAFQMTRMSVKPVFAYGYIATLAVGALPGCLFAAFCFLAAVFRPDRDPHTLVLLYDMGLLTFIGSLGCFATNYLVLTLAILMDKNRIFPKWLGYMGIWQIVTEVLALPVFIFRKGAFAWNGAISFYEGTIIFAVFLTCLILLLRKAIQQQPTGELVLD